MCTRILMNIKNSKTLHNAICNCIMVALLVLCWTFVEPKVTILHNVESICDLHYMFSWANGKVFVDEFNLKKFGWFGFIVTYAFANWSNENIILILEFQLLSRILLLKVPKIWFEVWLLTSQFFFFASL